MEETIYVCCDELKTNDNYTYHIPPGLAQISSEDAFYTWKAEDGTVLGYGRKNLTVSSCLKVVQFITKYYNKPGESTFTYRVNDTLCGTMWNNPERFSVNNTTSIPERTVEPSGDLYWLLVILVVVVLLLLIPVLYFVLKRFKRSNGAAANTDQVNDAVNTPMLPINTESNNLNSLNNNHLHNGTGAPPEPQNGEIGQ